MDSEVEQFADYLDELQQSDPAAYRDLVTTLQSSSNPSKTPATSTVVGDPRSLLQVLKEEKQDANVGNSSFEPQFPGHKVMKEDGLRENEEGILIQVEPGFVMKTQNIDTKKKVSLLFGSEGILMGIFGQVFINFCHSEKIQSFSEQKRLDADGIEQLGLHVPLSIGPPHQVEDRKGIASIAYDVAVNSKVVHDCKSDRIGTFRNFVCELAIEYIEKKYECKLDPRYKLPRLIYRGELPPSKHYIRKQKSPKIEEVDDSNQSKTRPTITAIKTTQQSYSAEITLNVEDENGSIFECNRVAAADGGNALTEEELITMKNKTLHIHIRSHHEYPECSIDNIKIELQAEYILVKFPQHRVYESFLPFPIVVSQAKAILGPDGRSLTLRLPIDTDWDTRNPDAGSNPWLLANALETVTHNGEEVPSHETSPQNTDNQSLLDLFHLKKREIKAELQSTFPTVQWSKSADTKMNDPVTEDEELPEDKFHRRDMMSLHILEQRRRERESRQQEAGERREKERREMLEKQQNAANAGKKWQEMYPTEPEITYLSLDELVEKKAFPETAANMDETPDVTNDFGVTSEEAIQAAHEWNKSKEHREIHFDAAPLGFEIL
ncbi:unnamed protein product [Albugo candida]|uniref:PIH1 N-terminal domain-containing protein n=1 Tax=Albugo candida TaxID=65357 RepID=A0A024GBR0_9STRA|nr:unnamed protein product [Albugo candida]|eukprot:CCI44208.1 unnamed protein product [Albugo candida]